MATLEDVAVAGNEAAEGFKKMQYALLAFAGLTAIALVLVGVALIKTAK